MSDDRILQFRKMAEADPDNELGHFSLGKALLEADRAAEAVPSLQRVIELNRGYSKAYELLGRALIAVGQAEQAVAVLKTGVRVALERGDRMPADAMAAMLKELGAPVPEAAQAEAGDSPGSGPPGEPGPGGDGFACSRCGGGPPLGERPFKGALGEKIHANVCQDCWREWIGMGTKVINELGLVLTSPEGQQAYDMHMIEFLNLQQSP